MASNKLVSFRSIILHVQVYNTCFILHVHLMNMPGLIADTEVRFCLDLFVGFNFYLQNVVFKIYLTICQYVQYVIMHAYLLS